MQLASACARAMRAGAVVALGAAIVAAAGVPASAATAAGRAAGHPATTRGQAPVRARSSAAPVHPASAAPHAAAMYAAAARARASGHPVPVPAATTELDSTVANPDGTFTMTTSLLPARVRQNGRWVPVSAQLRRAPDGRLAPAAVPSQVQLSDGGRGPLVTMTSPVGGRLAVTFPVALRQPAVTGATAVYQTAVPGVSVRMTVDQLGGISETIRIARPSPAASKLLSDLALPDSATGLRLTANTAGDIAAVSPHGLAEFSGPPAEVTDSANPTAARGAGVPAARAAGVPARDSVSDGSIRIQLSAAGAIPRRSYPVQITSAIAPDVTSAGPRAAATGNALTAQLSDPVKSSQAGWVETQNGTDSDGSACSTNTNYNVKTDTDGNAIATNAWGYCQGLDQTYYTFDTSGLTTSMKDISAVLQIWENYSANEAACSTSYPVSLYSLGPGNGIIGTGTDEQNEPSLGSADATQNVDLGPNADSSNNCPQRSPSFNVTSEMTTAAGASDNYWNFGLQSGDKSSSDAFSRYGYFPDIETTFDLQPPAPAYQNVSPAPVDHPGKTDQGCGTTVPWIGATPSVTLGADFEPASGLSGENVTPKWKWSNYDTSGAPAGKSQSPGSNNFSIPTLTDGETYTWQAGTYVDDNGADSGLSTYGSTCSFILDQTPPTVPAVTSSTFPPSGTTGASPLQGTSGTFGFSSSDPAPAGCASVLAKGSGHCQASGVYEFVYSLNQPLPVNLPATQGCAGSGPAYAISATTSGGVATASSCAIQPANWGTNILYVEAVDTAGNVSASYEYDFYLTFNNGAPVKPGDVNGDGIPDLLATTTSGNLLLYPGGTDPSLTPVTAGTAATSPQGTAQNPVGWNQFKITHRGSWTPSQSVDDLFALKGADLYRYVQNTQTGAAPQFENQSDLTLMNLPSCPAAGTPGADPDNTANCTGYPASWTGFSQILAPGDAWAGAPAGLGTANDTGFPSMLAVDSANGSLWLFQGASGGQFQDPIQLGSSGWGSMTIIAPGTVNGQNTLWARDNTTGSLYSYPFIVDPASDIPTLNTAHPGTPVPAEGTGTTGTQITGISLPQSAYPTLTSPEQLSGGSCTAAGSTSCPGLYAEDAAGSIWYYTGQPATGTTQALTGSRLLVGGLDSGEQFSWSLADGTGTTASDASGNGSNGTLTSGASWATDPSRGTVTSFNGTSGAVNAAGGILSIRSGLSWSVSAWVDPASTTSGYEDAVSQDATQTSGFHLDVTAGGDWGFRRPLTDTASPSVVQAISSTAAQANTWTFLTATFNGSTGQMNLYVNGKLAGTANDPSPYSSSNPTAVGRGQFAGASTNWWNGSISDVQGFNYQLSASQIQGLYNGNGHAGISQLS